MKFKLLCTALALSLATTQYGHAQEADNGKDYKPYPHMFVGVHGGMQTTFTNYQQGKLITPLYGVSFGAHFNPVVGARLHVSGIQNKGGLKDIDKTYDYKYVNTDVDLMLNLLNMFSKNNQDRIFNLYLLAGVGLNYAWDNDDFTALTANQKATYPLAWEDDRLSHNIRAGLMFDFNIAKHFGVNVEVAANNLSDRYNSKTNNKDDWSLNASVGLVYKFGFKKKTAKAPVVVAPPVAEEWATRVDTIWYDDITYKDVAVEEKMVSNIQYEIRMSEPEPASKVQAIVAFVKKHKNCKIHVVAYADKGTGTPKLNMKYSKERAEKVVAALIEAGIDKKAITSEYKGDTVQPFPNNDDNRVAIVTVTGQGSKKEEVKAKKFRTEEVRYRVK